MKLKDQVAIITGGGRGLGRDIGLAFAREGAKLVVSGTSEGAVTATTKELRDLGASAIAVMADVSDEAAVARMVEATLSEFGQVDILVNNAGIIGPTAVVTEVAREDWDRTIAVNLTGAFLCAKAVLGDMSSRRKGKIINIASIAGHIGYAMRSPYSVSKWGMIGLSRTLAQEWGRFNIQVNTISPDQ
jgi:NAD(P)-dependent dehydrogenase (short-subunit alcohol dehydrogenase family)